jgi:oligopeptide transport system ATP-binding protein
MSSLNPALTVGTQVAEPINEHRGMAWGKALEVAKELLQRRLHGSASLASAGR